MFHNHLKSQTTALHRAIEDVPLLKDLATGCISLERYELVTAKMYGFWNPIEATLASFNLPIEWSPRALHLRQDLYGLGMQDHQIDHIPSCGFAPEPSDSAQAIGIVYVYQGSQMGGAVIHRALQQAGRIPQDCRTFYAPSKDNGASKWSDFTLALDNLSFSQQQSERAIHAARETFLALMSWLLLPSNTASS